MKKIKFGSFPLIDMSKQDRHCIDNYSIKNFADLITLNTQMSHIQSDTQKYITPDVILKYFNNPISEAVSNPDANNKTNTMKRAFRSLQDFHRSISGNAFYADKVTFPIYLENENNNGSHDYDFILLSNDLVPNEALDEIKYDDKVTLTFLFLKDMLYPNTKLSDIGLVKGDDTSYEIRGNIAKFIEFSRNNDTDPISAMVKLIKIAGMKKGNKTLQNGLISFVTANKALNESISQKFFNLFGGTRKTGQIKDIHFLLNEIKHIDIAKFFDDTTAVNKASHTNVSNIESTQSSGLERQYLAQKTQEYNKILSMVDSLVNFNLTKDVMIDDTNTIDGYITLQEKGHIDANGNTISSDINVNINHDQLINSIRNDYFDFLVRTLVEKTNTLLKTLSEDLMKNTGSRIKGANLEGATQDEAIQFWNDELKSIDIKVFQSEDPVEVSRLRNMQTDVERKINQLLMQKSFMMKTKEEIDADLAKAKAFQSTLTFNTDLVQSELVGLLHTIEADVYDNKPDVSTGITTYQDLMNVIGSGKSFTPAQLDETKAMKNLKFSIEQLTISIRDGIHASAVNGYLIRSTDTSTEDMEKITATLSNSTSNLEKLISAYIRGSLFALFTKMGREYGDIKLLNAQKYANLRAEKNPVIRRSVSQENNFKTFIISEKVLVALYDMLSYVDTQKYLAGLIAYPPSKINNELNQVKFVLKRLGLESNPVFIIGQGSDVILSSPDFLSLTGSSLFSKISMGQMKQICQLDYSKVLWNNNQMFKKLTLQKRDEDTTLTLNEIQKQRDAVQKIQARLRAAQDTHAKSKGKVSIEALAKLNAEIETLQKTFNDQKKDYNAAYKRYENAYNQTKTQEHVLAGQHLGTSNFTPNQDTSYRANNSKMVEKYEFKQPGNNQQRRTNQPWNQNRFPQDRFQQPRPGGFRPPVNSYAPPHQDNFDDEL